MLRYPPGIIRRGPERSPTPPACPEAPWVPESGAAPPLAPGAACPAVSLMELAAAYVPYQTYTTIYRPGEMPAPGTIFPELLRTPPLYGRPPRTEGRG